MAMGTSPGRVVELLANPAGPRRSPKGELLQEGADFEMRLRAIMATVGYHGKYDASLVGSTDGGVDS